MQEHRSPHPNPPTAYHGPNPIGGRDLIVGDLHGELDTLEEALKSLEFRPTRDRLFTVGDLIDRGPRSADALGWLARGRWAGGVRGNHEQMMVNAILAGEDDVFDEEGPGAFWNQNGGEWWYDTPAEQRADPGRWVEAIATMPYMTTIEYADRRVGLVHADGATDLWHHWDRLVQWTEQVCAQDRWQPTPKGEVLQHDLLWRVARAQAKTAEDPKLRGALEGVNLVITGHTPGMDPVWTRANVLCIDTGVHYEELGHLTIAETQDALKLHRFARVERFK